MAYYQNPGRGPMQKTGKDIPLNMKSPMYAHTPDHPKRKLGKTTVKEEDGMKIYITPYTDEGTLGSLGKPRFTEEGNKAYAKLTPDQRKAQDAKYNASSSLGTPDTKGEIVSKSVVLNPRGIKPVSFPEPNGNIVVKSKPVKSFSAPNITTGNIKQGGIGKAKNILNKVGDVMGGLCPSGKKATQGKCLTD
jgi:hypothetical protein